MTESARLPSFVVIGAVKAATTWTHAHLSANPALYLPAPEPHFFSTEYESGIGSYAEWFADAAPEQMIGEKSADYLAHPQAAERLADLLPEARLVVQLRNPVDRAYSDYKMLYRRGTIEGPPERYLTETGSEHPRFLADGLYAAHLERWFEHFAPSQVLVLLYEDIRSSPRQSIETICDHIGAPRFFDEELASNRVNNGSERLLPLPVRRTLAPLKPQVKPLRQLRLFQGVRGLFAREIDYPPMSDALRARLIEYYAPDVEQLEQMLGRSLGRWLGRRKERPRAQTYW